MTLHVRKPDAAAIEAHIEALARQSWLGPARSWWPKHVFRFDEIESAASILNSGALLSRGMATLSSAMLHDSAHGGVIAHTSDEWKQHVRLYFRPRSPTQYANEGFRCRSERGAAHCPIPVVLVLDAVDVLTRKEAIFSDGNLASYRAQTGQDAAFLESIPWPTVYHEGGFSPEERDEIIFRRHAEVVIPDQLDLDPVRFIGCRSQAEFETLWHLLTPEARVRWKPRIGPGTKGTLHFGRWMFVDQVTIRADSVIFNFNPSCSTRGPFAAEVSIRPADDSTPQHWQDERDLPPTPFTIRFKTPIAKGTVIELKLDGRLAYRNSYAGEDELR